MRITPLKIVVFREMARNKGSYCQLVNMPTAVKGTVGICRLGITGKAF